MNITKEMLESPIIYIIRLNEVKSNLAGKEISYQSLKILYPEYEWKEDLKEISKLAVKILCLEDILQNINQSNLCDTD